MTMFRNRLLVPLVLIAVLMTALGASVSAAPSPYRYRSTTGGSITLKSPGAGRFSGEPDASGGTGAPQPKVVPAGVAIPVTPDSPLWMQMATIATMKFWFALRNIH